MKKCPGGPEICLDRRTVAWAQIPTIVMAIILLLIIITLIEFVAYRFFGPEWGLKIFGPLACLGVMYFSINSFIKEVPGNTAIVLVDNLAPFHPKWELGTDSQTKSYSIFSIGRSRQRTITEGWQIMTPFQKEYKVVDLRREIPITFGEKDTFLDKNGVICRLKAMVVLRVIPELAPNFAASDEGVIVAEFRARAEASLNQYMANNDLNSTLSNFDKFQTYFEATFGGPKILDTLEARHGVWTGTPILSDLNVDEEFAKANEAAKILQLLTSEAKKMVEESNNTLAFVDAYRIVQIQQKHIQAEHTSYEVNITGLPPGLTQFIAGGFPIGGGGGGKGKQNPGSGNKQGNGGKQGGKNQKGGTP